MDTELTSDKIIQLFASGELLSAITDGSHTRLTPDLSETEALCVDLHNSGAIDILSLTSDEVLASLQTHTFFHAARAIGRLIPYLVSTATAVMQSIERLIAKGGADLAANLPNGQLLEWFGRHQEEAAAVVSRARQGEQLAVRNTTFALQAIKGSDEARSMAKDFVDERRTVAITALSRIEEADQIGYQKSLALFGDLLDLSVDDTLTALIIGATTWIFGRCDDSLKVSAVEIICRAAAGGGPHTRWSAAVTLRQHSGLLQSKAFKPLMELLAGTTSEEPETIRVIDGAMYTLVSAGQGQEASTLIATLIDQSGGAIKLENFPCFVSSLSTSAETLARMTLAWLLSGSQALCGSLLWQFQHTREEAGPPIAVPLDAMPANDSDFLFVARKAVGWLILKPVTSASILVTILGICGEEAADEIAYLLGSMLLMNYSSVQVYLERFRDDEKVGARIVALLAANQAYMDGLKSVPDMPELRPSDAHRLIQYERHALRAQQSGKTARKQSLLMSMIKQSRILHGEGTLSTVYGPQGENRHVNTPFKTIGYSVEMPRQEVIDPIGFNMVLMTLRLERRSS